MMTNNDCEGYGPRPVNNNLTPRMFVYGTLRPGGSLNFHMDGNAYVGPASLAGYKMVDTSHGFPTIFKTGALGDVVVGDVYILTGDTEATLSRLDRLEGEGQMYDRVTIRALLLASMVTRPVQVYVHRDDSGFQSSLKEVPGGDWQKLHPPVIV